MRSAHAESGRRLLPGVESSIGHAIDELAGPGGGATGDHALVGTSSCPRLLHRHAASDRRRKTLQMAGSCTHVTHRAPDGQDTKVTVQQALGIDEPPARLRLAHVLLFESQVLSESRSIGEKA
jgi:hypothetical protein